jgi:hypothetical protein
MRGPTGRPAFCIDARLGNSLQASFRIDAGLGNAGKLAGAAATRPASEAKTGSTAAAAATASQAAAGSAATTTAGAAAAASASRAAVSPARQEKGLPPGGVLPGGGADVEGLAPLVALETAPGGG